MKRQSPAHLVVFLLLMNNQTTVVNAQTTMTLAHVRNSFHFTVQAPLSRAAPLFGPEGERCWAGEDWNPEFLHPQPAADIQGAVFTVQQGSHKGVWVNTIFDKPSGRMQYVAFIPGALVFTVDVQLAAVSLLVTEVSVTYVRTALEESANEHVVALGQRDRENGPEWQRDIERCLKKQ